MKRLNTALRRIYREDAERWGDFAAISAYILMPLLWLVFTVARLFWE